jgi:alpha-beta hydrolase superfamily lysophospholipase
MTGADPTTVHFPSVGGVQITAYRWDPDGKPAGIAQLTHGMGEHALRYGPLAEALNARGLVVYGQDHRGHGATGLAGGGYGVLGENGWVELVNDIGRLTDLANSEYPNLPLLLIGHSMGSFAIQQYLIDHSDRVNAAALTGTAAIDLLAPAMNLDEPIDLSLFNAAFAPARTDFDWLSRDEKQVDRYVKDPGCGFSLDLAGSKSLFQRAVTLAKPAEVSRIHSDLPLYIAVGDADPVNGGLTLLHPLVQRYREAGLTDITLHVYPSARHEIFNETNRDEVVADLLTWALPALRARECEV